jgi:hypothetical protein
MTISTNKRCEERVRVALPVRLDNASGVTRDVSVNYICFEAEADYTPGNEISFTIEVGASTEKMLLKCKGTIVRTEMHDQKTSVAVKIIESIMESAHNSVSVQNNIKNL